MEFWNTIIGCSAAVADVITTIAGLSMGFAETHAAYSFLGALSIILPVGLTLDWLVSSYNHKFIKCITCAMACIFFLGAVNNTLVIFFLGYS